MEFSVLITALLSSSFLCRIIKWHFTRYKFKTLPQPKRFFENFAIFVGFDPNNGFQRAMDMMKHKDGTYMNGFYGGMYMDGSHCINFTSPEAAKCILTQTDLLHKTTLTYSVVEEVLGKSIVTENGGSWKKKRKALTPLFHFESLKNYIPTMIQDTKQFIQDLQKKNSDGTIMIHGNKEMKIVTLNIIIDAAFGGDFNHDAMFKLFEDFGAAFTFYFMSRLFLGSIAKIIPFQLFGLPNMMTNRKAIEELIRNYLEETDRSNGNDLTAFLVQAKVPNESIVDQILTFLFAGNDTTSNLLAWTIQSVGQNVEVERKVHAELDHFFLSNESDFTRLQYLHAVIQEVQRMYPALTMLDRQPNKDCVIDGVHVPAGTTVCLWIYGTHMNPAYWDNPEQFRPERFIGSERRHPFIYVPFSAGPRTCIGRNFALQETMIVLAHIFHKFKVEVIQAGIPFFEGTLAPKDMLCKLHPRSHKKFE